MIQKEKRVDWIDIYKGIMIILVVVGHATGIFNGWIYQFHMAAFFFISGYLNANVDKNNNASAIIIKKIITLIIPYFFLGVSGFLFDWILNNEGIYTVLFGQPFYGIKNGLKELFLHGNIFVQYWGTFWFLIALFGIEVLHLFLISINNKKIDFLYLFFSMVLYLLSFLLNKNGVILKFGIFNFNIILFAQLYYYLGYVNRVKNIVIINKKDIVINVSILICSIAISFWGFKNNVLMDIVTLNYGNSIKNLIVALASIYIIFFISNLLIHSNYVKKILIILGKNSLGIMIFHFCFFKVFFVILYYFNYIKIEDITGVVLNGDISPKYWLVLTIFSILTSLFFWKLINMLPIIKFLLGQDKKTNNKIVDTFCNSSKIVLLRNKISIIIDGIINFNEKIKSNPINSIAYCTIIVLCFIPFYRTGIIINDELQARRLAMEGFMSFYKQEFHQWMNQGRLLAAPINSFTKYIGFIYADKMQFFEYLQVLMLIIISIFFALLIKKIFDNSYFSIFAGVTSIFFMPISFEHTSPNAFVTLFGLPFVFLIVSLILYVDCILDKKFSVVKICISMFLFLLSCMSYEVFVTYVVLYFMIMFGKKGIDGVKNNVKMYLFPFLTAVIYIFIYVLSSKLVPSTYDGNQIGIKNIKEVLLVIKNLFISCIPGYYLFSEKYRYMNNIYSTDILSYLRIIMLAFAIGFVFYNLVVKINKKLEMTNNVYVVLCGICFMVLPSLPNSISLMYQGNVGEQGFTALPVTFFESYAAIFVFTFVIWKIAENSSQYYRFLLVALLLIMGSGIQSMNDKLSIEQHSNFNRLLSIEKYLNTQTVKDYQGNQVYSKDLYLQKNLLYIHDNYWSQYCNNNLGVPIEIVSTMSNERKAEFYYDEDNFVIVDRDYIKVLSFDKENTPKAIRVGDDEYCLFEFVNETMDGECYVYSTDNGGDYFSKQGYTVEYGCMDDDWLNKNSSFYVTTGEKGFINIELYYPEKDYLGKRVIVSVDDNVMYDNEMTDNIVNIELDTQPNTEVNIKIDCDFEIENKGSDTRELSIILQRFLVE